MNKFKLVFYMICNSRIKVSVVVNITLSSSYYLRIEDLVLASAYCTRHVTVCMPPLSKLHRKKLSIQYLLDPKGMNPHFKLIDIVSSSYGSAVGASPPPVDILNMNAAAPLFASAPDLSFHGHAVRPPP